jgi:hypothetical protein
MTWMNIREKDLNVDAAGKKSKEKRNTRWKHYANNSRQLFIEAKDQY